MLFVDGRGGEIRTPDPLFPKQMRYQAALRPDAALIQSLFKIGKPYSPEQGQTARS